MDWQQKAALTAGPGEAAAHRLKSRFSDQKKGKHIFTGNGRDDKKHWSAKIFSHLLPKDSRPSRGEPI